MEGGLALDALGDVDGGLDAVVAESAGGGCAIDGSAAVAAENTIVSVSDYLCVKAFWIRVETHVAPVLAEPINGAMPMGWSISMIKEDVVCDEI